LAVGGDRLCSWWREAETLSVGEGEAETVGLVGLQRLACSGWSAWSWEAAVGGGWGGGRWRWKDEVWGIFEILRKMGFLKWGEREKTKSFPRFFSFYFPIYFF
jgi:hypothetical protein